VKISIITINFNNCFGLEKTITSVINQTYKNIEYIVIDGGSMDGSIDIIKQHASGIDYWVSEKDNGIFHAMNKGISKATGEYLLFMNSGDCLINSNVLDTIFSSPLKQDIVYGNVYLIDNESRSTWCPPAKLSFDHFVQSSIPHQASFIKRRLFTKVGLYNEKMKISADWKFFLDAIVRHNCSYTKVEMFIAECEANGLSRKPDNQNLLREEYFQVITNEYAELLFGEYKANFKIASQVKLSRLIALLKKIGFLKNIDIS